MAGHHTHRTVQVFSTRSRVVTHNGVVTTVATATDKSDFRLRAIARCAGQHRSPLAEAGTDKSHVLMVMIYLTDIDDKPDFNRAWDGMDRPENLPLRACVGVELEEQDLVELVVTAAVRDA